MTRAIFDVLQTVAAGKRPARKLTQAIADAQSHGLIEPDGERYALTGRGSFQRELYETLRPEWVTP